MTTQSDLFQAPVAPKEPEKTVDAKLPLPLRWYWVRIDRIERLERLRGGLTWRLVGAITRGPYAGATVYKPLSNDTRGAMWAREAIAALGLPFSCEATLASVAYFGALAKALVDAGELYVHVYHYEHPMGVFPTISKFRRVAT